MDRFGEHAAIAALASALWLLGVAIASLLVGVFALAPLVQAIIWLAPGWLATAAIELAGKQAQTVLAVGVAAGVVAVAVAASVGYDRLQSGSTESASSAAESTRAVLGVLSVFLVVVTLSLFYFAGVPIGPGLLLAPTVALLPLAVVWRLRHWLSKQAVGRRSFLRTLGLGLGTLLSLGAVSAVGERLRTPSVGSPEREKIGTGRTVGTPTPSAGSASTGSSDDEFGFDFDAMPSRVTSVDDHYVVDINYTDPNVDAAEWSLAVDGDVADPYSLSYDDLLDHADAVTETVTMVCISNPVGGSLIGTARWRGVPLRALLDDAGGPREGAVDVVTHAVDGYSEAIPLDVATRPEVVLAFAMNGRALRASHGFPARLLIPGRYGMKSTKWVERVEVVSREHDAYWEKRGWDERAVVNTLSYLRGAERRGNRVAVGGVAYAGLRGVEGVEVSLDGGDTWHAAELEDEISPHAWRRWRHVFEDTDSRSVTAVVRAVDGTGALQTRERSNPHPAGSTGWHERKFRL